MSNVNVSVHKNLKDYYDNQYKPSTSEWRELCAAYKASHITDICKKNGISPKNLLEVGAGEGSILFHMDKNAFCDDMHALEISESGVHFIKERKIPSLKEVKVFDGYNIPYENNQFDVAVLSHVLEHVEYERIILRELRRVSKHQVIEIPCDYFHDIDKRVDYYKSYGHINVYTPTKLRFLLKTEGFKIIDDNMMITEEEIVHYNTFNNNKKEKSFVEVAKLNRELANQAIVFSSVKGEEKEKMANSYIVLTS